MSTEPRRLGKYELRERLARGGQGEVWKAFDPQLRRYVAIKQLHADLQSDPDFIERFQREAQFIASLHHPNIVQIHDFQTVQTPGSDKTTAYMVMDYIEGSTLAAYIRNTSRKGLFPSAADIVYIFTGVSLALDYAHGKGMIHRDIKPANIMLDERASNGRSIGQPTLTDFGIAKLQGVSAETTHSLGTPLYVSPEQAQGLPGDKRSDLYSLGIILYEMTTGITPFRGDSMMAILMQHFQDLPTPPALINPQIPPALSEVILKSIEKSPDARFQTASAMTIALAQVLNLPVPNELSRNIPTLDIGSNSNAYNRVQPSAGMTPYPLTPPAVQVSPLPVVSSPSAFTPSENGRHTPSSNYGVLESGPHSQSAVHAANYVKSQTLPAPPGVLPPIVHRPPTRQRKNLYIALSALLVLAMTGASVLYAFFASKGTPTPPVSNEAVGQVFFLRSPNAPPGSLDQMQITLQSISNAPEGKQYYAWLLHNNDSTTPIYWSFNARSGPYSHSDPRYSNLLTSDPSTGPYLFLITLQGQDIGVPPPNVDERLYYAKIPQTKASDNFSVVDHLNHLLTDDPNLKKLGLDGGLNYRLVRNTQAISAEATGARAAWQNKETTSLRQHLINILYYLEGTSCAPAELSHVPGGTLAAPGVAIAHDASASLLECKQNTVISSILFHIQQHMMGVIHAPGVTHNQIVLTQKIQTETAQVQALLEQLHSNVLQLIQMSDTQLLQPSQQNLIDTTVMMATTSYNGTASQSGAQQVSNNIQHLATFDILPCPQSSSNNVCLS